MRFPLWFVLMFSYFFSMGQALRETPQQTLNQYVSFLNHSVDEVASRYQRIQPYYADVSAYRSKASGPLRLSPSGTLEDYYYKKALGGLALTAPESQRLQTATRALWQLVSQIDQTAKALETYDRLKDYKQDNFKKLDALMADFKALIDQFSRDKTSLYNQIEAIYRRYQPYKATDAYLFTEKEMNQVLATQQQLLDTLSYYLNDKAGRSNWPVELVQQSILDDEKLLASFGQKKVQIKYPASDMMNLFKSGLQTIQTLKRHAVDEYTFAARQSAQHSNEFYRTFINHYNNDLRSAYENFVTASVTEKQLLEPAKFSLVFAFDVPETLVQKPAQKLPFRDVPPLPFATKPATAFASAATNQALNSYVDFINESLRQMNQLQLLVRNYQSSAEPYRDPARSSRRSALTYSHETFKVPVSEHQLLSINNPQIPQAYRLSISGQADVLLAMLKEMDALSIELIDYTNKKQYEQDHLQRSDAILDRYAYLVEAFDQKKEQLYRDVRRIHESYPVKEPASSWNVSGKAMRGLLDSDQEILFGVKDVLKGKRAQLPPTDLVQAQARTLISNEFTNLKGLQRLGRSNGLCPYTPYEDLADNSLKLAEMTQRLSARTTENPFESFYYFYNNELVYQYNSFADLAKRGLLKAINQPNAFAFRRLNAPASPLPAPPSTTQPSTSQVAEQKPVNQPKAAETPPLQVAVAPKAENKTIVLHDTVYVNRTTVDTVYIDRSGPPVIPTSLKGFAANNMVLLLDVSASMESPFKLPLLKKSIKSLLTLLRPEDQISIVVYSGKAKVALKPTSGANTEEITRVIDRLKSDGETDGNEGLRLAYKVANKNYLRAGNNRIVLATDGEFPISDKVFDLVEESSQQDVYLTVFTFGRTEIKSNTLKKLAKSGKGTYAHITADKANLQLILEAQAKKAP